MALRRDTIEPTPPLVGIGSTLGSGQQGRTRSVLEALGGTLQIIAVPGQGTTLLITLPAPAPDPDAGGALPHNLWQCAGVH